MLRFRITVQRGSLPVLIIDTDHPGVVKRYRLDIDHVTIEISDPEMNRLKVMSIFRAQTIHTSSPYRTASQKGI